MNTRFGYSIYENVMNYVTRSIGSTATWIENSTGYDLSVVSIVQWYTDKTMPFLKDLVAVAYPLYVVLLNFTHETS